jgi:LmbE family N-acetylglucosaminyl deacetylase
MVVTIFAGRPPAGAPLTAWDAAAGFREGDDVMAARRAEDHAALAVLAARARWLPFRDAQYGGPLGADAILGDVATVISASRRAAVAVPLGLFHDDHRTTHEAALRVARRRPELTWLLYADVLYRRIPGALEARLTVLAEAGAALEPLPPVTGHASLKRRALACYRSQLRALGTPGRPGIADALAPEQYWRLRP